jgi:hypothetical protein
MVANKYFRREFLAETDDADCDTYVIARVTDFDEIDPYLSASLNFRDEENRMWLSFYGSSVETIEKRLKMAKTLYEMIGEFYKALEEVSSKTIKALNKKA